MSDTQAVQGIESVTIEAVVTRADGTKEDLGAVAEWHAGQDSDLEAPAGQGLIEFFKGLGRQ